MVRSVSRRADESGRRPAGLTKQPQPAPDQTDLVEIKVALAALAAEVAAVRRRQDDIGAQGSQIHAQLLVVGHVLEQLRDARSRRSGPPRWAVRLGSGLAERARWFRMVFLRPRHNLARLRDLFGAAQRTSVRSHWTGRAWVARVDRGVLWRTVVDDIRMRLFRARPVLYRVQLKQRQVAPPRPRILHAIPNVWVGGSTQLIVDIFDHLGHRFDMHVLTSSTPPHGRHEGMTIHEIPDGMTSQQAGELIAKFRPDLVHVHYWGEVDLPWYRSVFQAAEAAGVPVIENVNTPVAPYRSPAVSRYVYVSRYILEAFGRGRKNESVIYPGINFDQFKRSDSRLSRDALNSIGMVYRLEPDKLNLASIKLFIEVVRRRPSTRVFIIGHGTFFEPYLDAVTAAGVRDNFVFTGRVPYEDLPAYYSQFAVFVAPVWKESFGQVTPFAMNMGRAVAGFDVGAISEIIETNATLGDSVDEAAEKIVALLDDPAEIERLGELNHAIAQRKYGVQTMCDAYGRLYDKVLGKGDTDIMPGFPPAKLFN